LTLARNARKEFLIGLWMVSGYYSTWGTFFPTAEIFVLCVSL